MPENKSIINSTLYLIPYIISNSLALFTLPILTRYLSVSDFGIYALLQVFQFLYQNSNFGLTAVFEREFLNIMIKITYQSCFLNSFICNIFLTLFIFITYLFKENISLFLFDSDIYSMLFMVIMCNRIS